MSSNKANSRKRKVNTHGSEDEQHDAEPDKRERLNRKAKKTHKDKGKIVIYRNTNTFEF